MQACTALLNVRPALQEGLCRGFVKYFHSNNNTTTPVTPQFLVNPKQGALKAAPQLPLSQHPAFGVGKMLKSLFLFLNAL